MENEQLLIENKAQTMTNVNDNTNDSENYFDKVEMTPQLFLLFAEFIGYDSPLVEFADNLMLDSKKDKIPEYIKKIIKIDAYNICESIKEEYDLEIIKENFNEFYPFIMNSLNFKNDDLPF